LSGRLNQRLAADTALWVVDTSGARAAWWRRRIGSLDLDVRRPPLDRLDELRADDAPAAIALDLGVGQEVSGLQSIARWRERRAATLVLVTADASFAWAESAIRAAGAHDVVIGWGACGRACRLLERFRAAHRRPIADPYDLVARRLPGRFR